MKRKGETFTEFLTAAAVFGVMMTGIVEFMANQTDNLAKVRHMDDMMYYAKMIHDWSFNDGDKVKNHNILYNIAGDITAGIRPSYYYTDRYDTSISIAAKDSPIAYIEDKIVSFDWDTNTYTLTVKKTGGVKMDFKFKP